MHKHFHLISCMQKVITSAHIVRHKWYLNFGTHMAGETSRNMLVVLLNNRCISTRTLAGTSRLIRTQPSRNYCSVCSNRLSYHIEIRYYRGADKSLARSGRKQVNVSARMALICFGALPCKEKKKLDSSRLDVVESNASLTCFRACFLPGRAKDLSAPRYGTPVCC